MKAPRRQAKTRKFKNRAKKPFWYRRARVGPWLLVLGILGVFSTLVIPDQAKNYSKGSYVDWKAEADQARREAFEGEPRPRPQPKTYSKKKSLQTQSLEKPSPELLFPPGTSQDPMSDLSQGLGEQKAKIQDRKQGFEQYKTENQIK